MVKETNKQITMTFNEYQTNAVKTAIYGEGNKVVYPTLGLCGEAGEVAEKIKKVIRDKGGVFSPESVIEIKKELSDVLWYLANIANDLGITLDDVAVTNLEKLESRRARNLIHGSGDNR
jgi:NTP pyrophosphatase (non-canonical NTP hydrolase)